MCFYALQGMHGGVGVDAECLMKQLGLKFLKEQASICVHCHSACKRNMKLQMCEGEEQVIATLCWLNSTVSSCTVAVRRAMSRIIFFKCFSRNTVQVLHFKVAFPKILPARSENYLQ